MSRVQASGSTSATATGRGARREPNGRRAELQRQLLIAARDLFSVQGFEATSVQEITDRAGTSVGSLYYYYGSKSDIYNAVFADYLAGQRNRTREAVMILREAGVTDGPRLFVAGVRAFLNNAWEHRVTVKLFSGGEAPAGFARMTNDLNGEWLALNETLLDRGDPSASKALVVGATGAMGMLSSALAEIEDPNEAAVFIDRAVEVLDRMVQTE